MVAGAAAAARRACMFWSFMHGHAYPTTDRTSPETHADRETHAYMMAISRAVLGPPPAP